MKITTPMDENRMHVYPLHDYREHVIDPRAECWCRPTLTDDGIVVHHAMDGREKFERGEASIQ